METKKITTSYFSKCKKENKKISMLTAYDYSTAKLLDEAGIEGLLVGDSLGMVMLGYENTLQVTMEDMIHHCRSVARGTKKAMVVGDLPFLSYHISVEQSVKNAGRMIQEGQAQAVKLEGGREVLEQIKAIVAAQIPVMGHLGLTPQSVNLFGGFKVQGKSEEGARKIIEDALLLQEAGVFSIVLECIPEALSKLVTQRLDIPTIGIGAGKYCDGQILVTQDMLGMYSDLRPRFVKQYSSLGQNIKDAAMEYIKEIGTGEFPAKEHVFSIDEEVLKGLY